MGISCVYGEVLSCPIGSDADWTSPFESDGRLCLNGSCELSRKCIEIGRKAERSFFFGTGWELLPNLILYTIYRMTEVVNGFGMFTAHQWGLVPSSTEIDGARV